MPSPGNAVAGWSTTMGMTSAPLVGENNLKGIVKSILVSHNLTIAQLHNVDSSHHHF